VRSESVNKLKTLNEPELTALMELKQRLSQIFTLREVILFGSKIRGDAEIDSDLDVLVLIEEPKTWSHRLMVSDCCLEVNLAHDTNLSCLVENHSEWQVCAEHIWVPFKDNVMREGISVEF
jgi:hypothetical protein